MNIEEYKILQKAESILHFEVMRGCYFEEQWDCITNAHIVLAATVDVVKNKIDGSAVLPEAFEEVCE